MFFIWGTLCVCCFVYTYFLVPETKGLSLEQVDLMLEQSTPRTSSKWIPMTTFAADMDQDDKFEMNEERKVSTSYKETLMV